MPPKLTPAKLAQAKSAAPPAAAAAAAAATAAASVRKKPKGIGETIVVGGGSAVEAESYVTTMVDLSDDMLLHIGWYISPRDIYALALTCKRMWALKPLLGQMIQLAMRCQLDELVANIQPPHQHAPTRALRTSLEFPSLAVAYSEPHEITIQKLFPAGAELDSEGRPQIIIAGSIGVQAALGVQYKGSDIDIFCTWDAAPMIRERLIESCNMLCAGGMLVHGAYTVPDLLVGTAVVIDHVEGYAAMLTEKGAQANLSPNPYAETCSTQQDYLDKVEGYGKDAPTYHNVGLPVGGDADRRFPIDWYLEDRVRSALHAGCAHAGRSTRAAPRGGCADIFNTDVPQY